jgi:hypothetical protein
LIDTFKCVYNFKVILYDLHRIFQNFSELFYAETHSEGKTVISLIPVVRRKFRECGGLYIPLVHIVLPQVNSHFTSFSLGQSKQLTWSTVSSSSPHFDSKLAQAISNSTRNLISFQIYFLSLRFSLISCSNSLFYLSISSIFYSLPISILNSSF